MFIHFSTVTKMPCPAWGIPAALCITGQKLIREGAAHGIPYVCRVCYAQCGPTMFEDSQKLLLKNWEAYIVNPLAWEIAIAKKIWADYNCLFFWWFHSGDLQSLDMLIHICCVAERCPQTQFWLPTQESALVEEYFSVHADTIPPNLTIRVSSPVIDKVPAPSKIPGVCNSMVCYFKGTNCAAELHNSQCGTCRKCWDRLEPLVAYPLKVGKHYRPTGTAKRLGLI